MSVLCLLRGTLRVGVDALVSEVMVQSKVFWEDSACLRLDCTTDLRRSGGVLFSIVSATVWRMPRFAYLDFRLRRGQGILSHTFKCSLMPTSRVHFWFFPAALPGPTTFVAHAKYLRFPPRPPTSSLLAPLSVASSPSLTGTVFAI